MLGRFDDFCREWFGADGNVSAKGSVVSGKFPAAVLVHGDTSSAMAAALAAFHLRIPVMHVEAGLRAGGLNLTPFPEELNRRLISKIACFHFAPTATNQENLIRENIPSTRSSSPATPASTPCNGRPRSRHRSRTPRWPPSTTAISASWW